MRNTKSEAFRKQCRNVEERRKRKAAEHQAKVVAKTPPHEFAVVGKPDLGDAVMSHIPFENERPRLEARRSEHLSRKRVLKYGSVYGNPSKEVRDRR